MIYLVTSVSKSIESIIEYLALLVFFKEIKQIFNWQNFSLEKF